MEQSYRQAYDLLAAKQVRQAFDLSYEPLALRERYGLHRSGQACLLARRLVEAGVPWITVIWNHSNRGQDKQPGPRRLVRLGHAQRYFRCTQGPFAAAL